MNILMEIGATINVWIVVGINALVLGVISYGAAKLYRVTHPQRHDRRGE